MEFPELLRSLNVPVAPSGHHHTRQGWIQFDCPYCSPGTGRWLMGYSLDRKAVNCWQCGPHNLATTLAELGMPMAQAIGHVRRLPRTYVEVERTTGKLKPPFGVAELLPKHTKYLKQRGFDPDEIRKLWDVRGIGPAGNRQFRWRLFIPVHLNGEVVSWLTRSTDKHSNYRWMSAKPNEETYHHKHLLYGEDYCRHAIIVHEGPTDVWRTGPGAVATMGLGYTTPQLNRMAKYPVRVVCFDNSHQAEKRAQDLADSLSVFPGETHLVWLDSEDPGSASQREVDCLRKFLC